MGKWRPHAGSVNTINVQKPSGSPDLTVSLPLCLFCFPLFPSSPLPQPRNCVVLNMALLTACRLILAAPCTVPSFAEELAGARSQPPWV